VNEVKVDTTHVPHIMCGVLTMTLKSFTKNKLKNLVKACMFSVIFML
jgi:hypothetical protein